MAQRNSEERAFMLAERIAARRKRTGRTQVMPARVNLSTRGQRKPTWFTKKHTPSRLKDLAEHRKSAPTATGN